MRKLTLSLGLLLLPVASALAVPVTWELSGTTDYVDDAADLLGFDVAIGDTFTYRISFDNEVQPSQLNSDGAYFEGVTALDLFLGTNHLNLPIEGAAYAGWRTASYLLDFAYNDRPGNSPDGLMYANFNVLDANNTLGLVLPLIPPDPSLYPNTNLTFQVIGPQFYIEDDPFPQQFVSGVHARMSSIRDVTGQPPTSVPEPGTLGLMALALLGVGAVRRRRWVTAAAA